MRMIPAYTDEAEVVEAFWQSSGFDYDKEEAVRQRRDDKDYRTDVRVAFVEYVDYLAKDGLINDALAQEVTL